MNSDTYLILAVIAVAVAGYLYLNRQKLFNKQTKEEVIATGGISEAEAKAREILLEAKDEALKVRHEAEDDARQTQQQVLELERKAQQKEEQIDLKLSELNKRENELDKKFEQVDVKLKEVDEIKVEQVAALEKAAKLTKEEAKKSILEALDVQLRDEKAKRIKEAEEALKLAVDDQAKSVLVDAMKHGATDYVAEYTTSMVKLPDDDAKGRIIGKEGRNIKAFEMATGVDVDIDDTPGMIRLSCFDGVRREIARLSLEELVKDGRIQPTRIEEVVTKKTKDVEKITREAGEKLARDAGAYNLPREVVEAMGKFKFRFSYGQNMLAHTLEETRIAMSLAREVGADVNTVRLGALFHDIGKVFTEEEGTHIDLGANFIQKFGFPKEVVNIIAEHHEDQPFSSIESVLVYIADAISGSRPGARHEGVEEYIKRLKEIENVANSFHGVDKTYAIQAGREVRVIVKPEDVDDSAMVVLAHDIAEKIHDSVTYPGQVRVTVVRETRAFDTAK
jgi:ribonuclease Y